jgi:hypothetical protein
MIETLRNVHGFPWVGQTCEQGTHFCHHGAAMVAARHIYYLRIPGDKLVIMDSKMSDFLKLVLKHK